MQIAADLDCLRLDRDTVVTVGTFDGVHRGHQHLLRELVARARDTGRSSAALSFHPHPRVVLLPEARPTYLSTIDERAAIIEAMGVDVLVVLPFTHALASTPPREFLGDLSSRLRMCELWVGEDFALGRGRSGNTSLLRSVAQEMGYVLRVVEPLADANGPISSTRIRDLLSSGNVSAAQALLGRNYAVSGTVARGAQRGRDLGFRTANLQLPQERVLPADGVYAVWVNVGDQRLGGVANVGTRPSFVERERLLEAHIFDYEGDLYGRTIHVEFVERLRDEKRFVDPADLVAQIHRDAQGAREVLGLAASVP